MTSRQGFVLHPEAAQDILEIWEYVASESLPAARRLRQEIFESIQNLVEFPHRGHTRIDLTSNPLRFQIVRDYLIAYAPDERPLTIVSVVHGRRNPRVIAAILRSRE
jgi:plasmid stabilization system protein ParE